jgi:hypothetical protein
VLLRLRLGTLLLLSVLLRLRLGTLLLLSMLLQTVANRESTRARHQE